ncbi:hypothetical protein C1646_770492 [Rhizophagus diaphanus]|nr:hypothetical protein C1646_770492 [Rhizophagus diaphanus] [Rhizophagus sp. MUCL 43196]
MNELSDDYVCSVVNTLFAYHQDTKLVSVNFLHWVNNTTIGQILLPILHSYNIFLNISCLFLSNSAAYMKKCYHEVLKREYEEESQNETVKTIYTTLQNLRDTGIITIYIYFISIFTKEFVQDLDFFQQQNKPVFPFVEGQLQQLTAFIESNITASYFVFQVAHDKFSAHIPNHPARLLFNAYQVFNSQYIHLGNIQKKNICHYSAIMELDNSFNGLLCEWAVYCELEFNENLDETNLGDYWNSLSVHLPILSSIALDYIWLPISSRAVKCSFFLYNTLLDSNR